MVPGGNPADASRAVIAAVLVPVARNAGQDARGNTMPIIKLTPRNDRYQAPDQPDTTVNGLVGNDTITGGSTAIR